MPLKLLELLKNVQEMFVLPPAHRQQRPPGGRRPLRGDGREAEAYFPCHHRKMR